MFTKTPKVLLVAVFCFLPLLQTAVLAQSEPLSPAARRAAIRDSLRRERLEQRENSIQQKENKVQLPQTEKTQPTSEKPAASPGPASTPPATQPVATEVEVEHEQKELPISDTIMVPALNVRDTDIRDVLQGLGVQYGVNILVDTGVQGKISVNLHDIPLKNALRLIAEENGYRLNVMHGAVKVEKPAVAVPKPPPPPPLKVEKNGSKFSVDIKDASIEDVARKLVEVSGKNIIVDRSARGDVTAFFKDLEFPRAIELIAKNNGFMLRKTDDDVYTIYQQAWQAGSGSGETGQSSSGRFFVQVKKGKVDLEINNAPLENVITALSSQADISTVIYGNLQGTSTMKVKDVTMEDVFQFLLRGTDFTFWVRDSIYFIGPHSMQAVSNSKLLILSHLQANDALEALPEPLKQRAQIEVIKSQNALMVMGTYEVIDGIEQYIQQIDLPIPQILIEALVVDVDMDKIREYGINLFLGDYRRVPSSESIYPKFEQVYKKERVGEFIDGIPGLKDIITLPKNFVAKVEALEREKILKIRSKPQISTLNGHEATIRVGQTQYFLLKSETDYNQTNTVTTRVSERFEKIEANVTLKVVPFVTGKGEITCDIVPDFSEPEGSFDSRVPPTLNHRTLQSKVRLRDGETIVLGGLVKESENATHNQFPFLGSIPILGWLFKNVSTTKSRSQLIIFVTPHIYYGRDAHVDPENYIESNADLK